TGIASLSHLSEQNNFSYLAGGLVLLMFAGALLEYFPGDIGPRIMQAATVVALLIGTGSQKSNRSRFFTGLVAVLVMFLLVVGGTIMDRSGFGYLHLLLMLCFFVWMTWLAVRQVLFTGSITSNDIVGAICIYMLLGLIWAMLYLFIAEAVPGAFNGLPQAPWIENFSAVVYFSFVTITTLGYGDVSPVLPLARFLVTMEAIVGVFYMAILVASLIGVRMSDRDAARR
ncbi:MAG: ion channel, partial [Pseudomonadota bacterium]|nr:ion channel [Pseudomonadota bacterium]